MAYPDQSGQYPSGQWDQRKGQQNWNGGGGQGQAYSPRNPMRAMMGGDKRGQNPNNNRRRPRRRQEDGQQGAYNQPHYNQRHPQVQQPQRYGRQPQPQENARSRVPMVYRKMKNREQQSGQDRGSPRPSGGSSDMAPQDAPVDPNAAPSPNDNSPDRRVPNGNLATGQQVAQPQAVPQMSMSPAQGGQQGARAPPGFEHTALARARAKKQQGGHQQSWDGQDRGKYDQQYQRPQDNAYPTDPNAGSADYYRYQQSQSQYPQTAPSSSGYPASNQSMPRSPVNQVNPVPQHQGGSQAYMQHSPSRRGMQMQYMQQQHQPRSTPRHNMSPHPPQGGYPGHPNMHQGFPPHHGMPPHAMHHGMPWYGPRPPYGYHNGPQGQYGRQHDMQRQHMQRPQRVMPPPPPQGGMKKNFYGQHGPNANRSSPSPSPSPALSNQNNDASSVDGSQASGSTMPASSVTGSSTMQGLPCVPSGPRKQFKLYQHQSKSTPLAERDSGQVLPNQISDMLLREVVDTNCAGNALITECEEEMKAVPMNSVLPAENRLAVQTNFYHLNVDVDSLMRNLIIYEIRGDAEVESESITSVLRTRRFAEQFRQVKRHFEDVTLVPPKWLYSRSTLKQALTIQLGKTTVTIMPCNTSPMIYPHQQAILVERYIQDKMREAGNICYRGDWVNKGAPETVLEAARIHKNKNAPDFDYGIRRACRLSVKTLTTGGFALCCSPSSIVRERVPVMTVLQKLMEYAGSSREFQRLVREQINGARVVSTYDPDRPTYHRLQIDFTRSPKATFNVDGKQMSYIEYFRTRYKRPLKADQHMHNADGQVLPTQYLHRTGSAHASSKMRQCIQRKCQMWSKDPDQFSRDLITQLNHLLKMDSVPISIEHSMHVPGFHLDSLRIVGLTKFTDSRSFYEMPSHFVKPANQTDALYKWLILHSRNTRKDAQKAAVIVKRKKQKEQWSDNFIGQPLLLEVEDIENTQEVFQQIGRHKDSDGILIILEGNRKKRTLCKARLTFLCEGTASQVGVPCQFIDVETIKKSKAAIQNVVNPQLLYKSPKNVTLWDVSVDNYLRDLPEINFRTNFVSFGHDICHFDTNTGRTQGAAWYPSVAAMAMDMDPFAANRGSVRTKTALLLPRKLLQKMNMNLYDLMPPIFLKQMLTELLMEFRENKGNYPKYQVLYFDSPAGHPLDAIKKLYIPPIREANKDLGIDARIVVVIVNKRPIQRLFTQFSGIIVDSVISNPDHREFLMKKYTTIPTSNIVVYDEWEIYSSPERTKAFYYINYAMTFSYGPHDKSRRIRNNKRGFRGKMGGAPPRGPQGSSGGLRTAGGRHNPQGEGEDFDEEEAEGIAVQACLKYADHAARWNGEIILPEHHSLSDLGFMAHLHRPMMLLPQIPTSQ